MQRLWAGTRGSFFICIYFCMWRWRWRTHDSSDCRVTFFSHAVVPDGLGRLHCIMFCSVFHVVYLNICMCAMCLWLAEYTKSVGRKEEATPPPTHPHLQAVFIQLWLPELILCTVHSALSSPSWCVWSAFRNHTRKCHRLPVSSVWLKRQHQRLIPPEWIYILTMSWPPYIFNFHMSVFVSILSFVQTQYSCVLLLQCTLLCMCVFASVYFPAVISILHFSSRPLYGSVTADSRGRHWPASAQAGEVGEFK